MTADCFFDTNVLIYAAVGHKAHPEKYAKSAELVASERYSTSAQVLAEFYVNVTRKSDLPLSPAKAAEWVSAISLKPCQEIDEGIVMRGIEYAQRFQISYWDGAILAAAERLGVTTLYTEDLNHGQAYGTVRVVNPFLSH